MHHVSTMQYRDVKIINYKFYKELDPPLKYRFDKKYHVFIELKVKLTVSVF